LSAADIVAEARAAEVCPGRMIGQHLRQMFDKLPRVEAEGLPARTWRGMDPTARLALVMLASQAPGNPDDLARQSWDAFSAADKLAIGSTARLLSAGLAGAACLW
jgi:hypothetical protein